MNYKSDKNLTDFYKPDEKLLFIGNGPNQLQKRFSWDDLLRNVCRAAGLSIERRQKTFPLFFEEISYTMNAGEPVENNIRLLKATIGKEALKLTPHQLLINMVDRNYYDQYLTTNYDYCIEKAIAPDYDPYAYKEARWPKYSLHRYNTVAGKNVWHIHGESLNGFNGQKVNYPESSIMIGFEHYSDYLEKIHHFIKSNNKEGLYDLIKKEQDAGLPNWVHLFFIHDIDMVGFGMDYTESHLWFILNFRARLKRAGATIPNKIRWIIPMFSRENEKDNVALLMALEVEINYINSEPNNYEDFYRMFIHTLR